MVKYLNKLEVSFIMEKDFSRLKTVVLLPFFLNTFYYGISSIFYLSKTDYILDLLNLSPESKGIFIFLVLIMMTKIAIVLFIPYYFLREPIYIEKRKHILLLSVYNLFQAVLILVIQLLFLFLSSEGIYLVPVLIGSIYIILCFIFNFMSYRLYTRIYVNSINLPIAEVANTSDSDSDNDVVTLENLN